MKKVTYGIVLLVFLCQSIMAQSDISAFFEVNYNTFSHSSLSNFQLDFRQDITEVDLVVNDDFGANFGFSGGLKVDTIKTQFFIAYNTTGGKMSYSDFSGSIRLTQLLKGYTFGGEYHLEIAKGNKDDVFYFGARGLVTLSSLSIESSSSINNVTTNDFIDFRAVDFGIGIRLIYDIPISIVKLRLNIGYDQVFGGKFRFKENTDAWLENNAGDPVRTSWSGLRTGVGVVVPF
jgi:hypothetical protein